jgi:hypothetical protein
VSGATFKCLKQGSFNGSSYSFLANKKIAEACDAEAAVQTCTSSQKADLLVLEDGKKYDLADMEDSLQDELVALAANGTAASDVPEDHKVFEYKD